MILSPEEQAEYREEIDYLIETRGYEYVWGKETVMDKTKGLLRNAPAKIADGLQRIASNPTIIAMNEKAKQMNANLCEQEAQRGNPRQASAKNSRRSPRPLQPAAFEIDFDNDHL